MSRLPIFRRCDTSGNVCREFSIRWIQRWITEIGDQLKTAPLTLNPDLVAVSKMYGPSTVLLGDAAHSFGPNLGIGFAPGSTLTRSRREFCRANAAIVDAKVLGDALKSAEGDVEAVGRAFHDQ